jgi:hypothetical protein
MIRAARLAPPILLAVVVLAGCSGGAATTLPSGAPSHPAPASPAGSPAGSVPAGEIDPAVPTACLSLGVEDCARARSLAAAELTATDPAPMYVQVGSFYCENVEGCPTTLEARPEGDVMIEFPNGTAISVHVKVAPDGTATTSRDEGFFMSVEPSSEPGLALGPTRYTLGHCGLFSGIDHGGSWWDPVGPVDADHSDAINSAEGVLTVTDPLHATFVSDGGFTVQLVRRTGPKMLPGCM